MRKSWAIFLWGVGAVGLLFWLPFAWYFKDGLGPGFVPSGGPVALTRFWDALSWPLRAYIAPPLLVGSLLYPWRSRRAP